LFGLILAGSCLHRLIFSELVAFAFTQLQPVSKINCFLMAQQRKTLCIGQQKIILRMTSFYRWVALKTSQGFTVEWSP